MSMFRKLLVANRGVRVTRTYRVLGTPPVQPLVEIE
jgi:acetyl/propionyl-CoA carboxylase alpha subunit